MANRLDALLEQVDAALVDHDRLRGDALRLLSPEWAAYVGEVAAGTTRLPRTDPRST